MRAIKNKLQVNIYRNSSRKYLAEFAQQAADSISPGSRVLDAGAGDCPYRTIFHHAHYESTDLCTVDKVYGKLSFICDLSRIPIHDDCYDLVFCSQTLEHVPDPKLLLAELYRVLKPDGKLFLSAPLFYEEHEIPYDYYRFTRFGISLLLEQVNFKIKSIDWLEGYYGTLAYQLKLGAKTLAHSPGAYGGRLMGWFMMLQVWFIKLLFVLLSVLFNSLDIRYKYTGGGMCKNYSVVAQKTIVSN